MLFIAAFTINIALVLAFQTSRAYDKQFKKLNTAAINVLIPLSQDQKNLLKQINNIKGVAATEKHKGLYSKATIHHFAGTDFEMNTVFYNKEERRTLNHLDILTNTKNSKNEIYIPNFIAKLGKFHTGDKITYSLGQKKYSFTIAGAVNEMQYGNYGTSLIGAYLPQKAYQTISSENKEKSVAEYSIKTRKHANSNTIKDQISSLISNKGISLLHINDYKTTKQARMMISNLLIAIFIAVALIIFLISLFLSSFHIHSHIEEGIIDMGVLKAIGYTSSNIILSEMIPYLLISALATLTGSLFSYTVLPTIANFLAIQSGFSFTPTFDLVSIFSIIATTIGIFAIYTYGCSRRIWTLEAISAIRGGGHHSYHHYFPLATSKLGVKPSLILKQTFTSPSQNILLSILTFGIMTLLAFSGSLLYNVNIKPDHFFKTISEENPSAIFTVNTTDNLQRLKTTLKKDKRVQKVLEYASVPLNNEDEAVTGFVAEDFSRLTNNIVYKGKNPLKSNEIAIGSTLAKKHKIGSKIKIREGNTSYKYTVTGYIQSINYQGKVCELTNKGYQKISPTAATSLNVYLKKKGASAANRFIKAYKRKLTHVKVSAVNYEQLMKNNRLFYASLVSSVIVIIFIIAMLIILLVMFMIINSLIMTQKQEFGIYKALGWSNSQLTLQLSLSFTPIIFISAVFSALIDLSLIPIITNNMFRLLGAMKNHFKVSLHIFLLLAFIVVAISFIISMILARKIKRIDPYSLLKA